MTEPWIQASDTAHDLLPPMSALSSHELVGENDRAIPSSPARLMLIGVIASVLFHLIIVLIVAKVSRPRSLPIAEGPPTSVQIRITHTSRSPSSTENAEVPIIMDPGPDPMPASEAIVTSSDNDVLNVQEAPEPQEAPITLESARQRGS